MILLEHKFHNERLKRFEVFNSPMLMLGNQEDNQNLGPGLFGSAWPYKTLDPDGGDIKLDLTSKDCETLFEKFSTVYNLGTIEHIWDCHAAYVNAAKMVKLYGHFVGHSPVGGYENHGIHITGFNFILKFFTINGFKVITNWFSNKDGHEVSVVTRGGGNILLWFAVKRIEIVKEFKAPGQIFKNGRQV